MKKIAILLVFTLGTFIVNAQSVVEGTKFMDNWSVGVNAGAVTPLTHASFFKGMRPGFGVGISKQLTPSFRFGISGNGIKKPRFCALKKAKQKTAFAAYR